MTRVSSLLWVLSLSAVVTQGCFDKSSGGPQGSDAGEIDASFGDQTAPDASYDGAVDAPSSTDGSPDATADAMTIADATAESSSDASPGDGGCPSGQVRCAEGCIDVTSDPNNCGGCGASCGGSCAGARCIVSLVTNQSALGNLALQGTSLYWTAGASIVQGSVSGGGVSTLTTLSQSIPLRIAVGGTQVFFSTFGTVFNSLMAVPTSGGSAQVLASGQYENVTVRGTSLYWADPSGGTILTTPTTGGTVSTIVSGQSFVGSAASDLAVDATNAYWAGPGGVLKATLAGGAVTTLSTDTAAQSVAIDATHVYWESGGTVKRVLISGGTASPIATGPSATALVVDASNVYWSGTGASAALMRAPITGGAAVTMTSSAGAQPGPLAIDATHAYWSVSLGGGGGGVIVSAPIGCGAVSTIATNVGSVRSLNATGGTLYWANMNGWVSAMPTTGGAVTNIAASASTSYVAVDATNVYWSDDLAGAVGSTPLAGGAAATLASGTSDPIEVAVAGSSVFWSGNPNAGGPIESVPTAGGTRTVVEASAKSTCLATTASNVYWSGANGVLGAPLTGGTPSTVSSASTAVNAAELATDGVNAYWIDASRALLLQAPVAGGNVVTLASGQPNARRLATDGTSIYWTVLGVAGDAGSPTGAVLKAPVGGGSLVTIASGQSPYDVAVDGTSVYWTNPGSNAVVRATPK